MSFFFFFPLNNEYAYLVNNNYARLKEKIDDDNVILEISDKGKERLNSLIHKVKWMNN